MAAPTEIAVHQLARLVGTPDAPVVLDVRESSADSRAIPAAIAVTVGAAGASTDRIRGRRVVVTCEDGRGASQGAAAVLRTQGIPAESLSGGMAAWIEADAPTVDTSVLPPRDASGCTTWVTRQRPKIDRIACPWLIRRFVDTNAVFLFVAPADVLDVAARFNATPYDVDDVRWSHRRDRCTFDTMLAGLGLESPPLARVADIVRAADTDRLDLAPQAAGLLAVSLGLSRMFRDDLLQLDAGMLVYDALYRWARDATDETHGWPTTGSAA